MGRQFSNTTWALSLAVAGCRSSFSTQTDPPAALARDIKSQMAAREYWASATDRGLQAPNRAQDFRTYLDEHGVRVGDRDAVERTPLVDLRLVGLGRGDALTAVGRGAVAGAEATGAAHSIRLATTAGRGLDYGKLAVVDARGISLASHFEVPRPDRIRIVVDDRDAEYPIVIDPLLTSTLDAVVECDQASSEFGVSVASAGDVDGDGYSDVIVGAYLQDAGQTDEGVAWVFHGSAMGTASGGPSTANGSMESNQSGGWLGFSGASAGDVNGDGYGDVIVGAIAYDAPNVDEGAAFILLGSPTGIGNRNPTTRHAELEGEQTSAWFGHGVASAGDVNGDGYADLIIGASFQASGQVAKGNAFVFHGGPAGLTGLFGPGQADRRLEFKQANSRFGTSVDSTGDVNGDCYADVIVGAHGFNSGQANEGVAFVYHGGTSGLQGYSSGAPILNASVFAGDFELDFTANSAGDLNGDGFGDMVVGYASCDSGALTNQGAVLVYMGSPDGMANGVLAPVVLTGGQADALFGFSATGAGDVNGDGYADVIVGVLNTLVDPQTIFVTSAENDHVVLGNSEGRPAQARQRRGDVSGIVVSPGGLSQASQFVGELFLRSPRGREYGKLEIEYCSGANAVFGGPTCLREISPSWTGLGLGGAPLSQTIPGLNQGATYIWRARGRYAVYHPTPPGPEVEGVAGPWYRVGARPRATDIRIGTPEPSAVVAVAIGGLVLASLGGVVSTVLVGRGTREEIVVQTPIPHLDRSLRRSPPRQRTAPIRVLVIQSCDGRTRSRRRLR